MKILGIILRVAGFIGVISASIVASYNYGYMSGVIACNMATFSAPSYIAIIGALPLGLVSMLSMLAGICVSRHSAKMDKFESGSKNHTG